MTPARPRQLAVSRVTCTSKVTQHAYMGEGLFFVRSSA